jgi:hypothetical protein
MRISLLRPLVTSILNLLTLASTIPLSTEILDPAHHLFCEASARIDDICFCNSGVLYHLCRFIIAGGSRNLGHKLHCCQQVFINQNQRRFENDKWLQFKDEKSTFFQHQTQVSSALAWNCYIISPTQKKQLKIVNIPFKKP